MRKAVRLAMAMCGNGGEYEEHHGKHHETHDLKEYVGRLINVDGTTGAHWTMEQTEPLRKAHAPHTDPEEFWASMNMFYSDYCMVAKQYGVDKPEFYVAMTKAFMDDPDGGKHRIKRYYEM